MQRTRNHGAYFMLLLSYILALAGSLKPLLLVIAPLVALHAVTVDLTYSKMLARKLGKTDLSLMIINAIPYLFLFRPYFLIPATIFLLSIILSYAKVNVLPQILGTLGLSSLMLPWISLAGTVTILDISVYVVWCAYTVVEALYVEYKLPFRKIGANVVRGTWAIFLLVGGAFSFLFPPLALSLIEPSIRFFKPGEKLRSASEIRELGKRGSKRTIALFALLAFTLILYHIFGVLGVIMPSVVGSFTVTQATYGHLA
ncbi:hypothetical protein [Metallosphaera javensis (ex Sakai et al. 2022)]|uniref:hypothetical protein n=1 Tax=Metallosphaera javensis (ex Sakai et al. 2022) TaxID=2775498 RepID=UPI002585B9CB|nr:MAG: hypothetical protein MjAS7_1677 [Metallosphaera javensis (ex Sakai et al. 2022)]